MKVIETKGITYEYPDGTKALDKVNFNVDEGKIVALLGPMVLENPRFSSTLMAYLVLQLVV